MFINNAGLLIVEALLPFIVTAEVNIDAGTVVPTGHVTVIVPLAALSAPCDPNVNPMV